MRSKKFIFHIVKGYALLFAYMLIWAICKYLLERSIRIDRTEKHVVILFILFSQILIKSILGLLSFIQIPVSIRREVEQKHFKNNIGRRDSEISK